MKTVVENVHELRKDDSSKAKDDSSSGTDGDKSQGAEDGDKAAEVKQVVLSDTEKAACAQLKTERALWEKVATPMQLNKRMLTD